MAKLPRPASKPQRGLEEPEVAYMIEPRAEDRFVDDRLLRLSELLDQQLGRALDPGKRARARQIMTTAAREQYALLEAADRGEVAADAYFERFAALLQRTFADIDEVLGRADFERVFGAAPDQALGIIDRAAYARAHRRTR